MVAERLALRVAQGQKPRDAAIELGLDESTAGRLARRTEFKEFVEDIRAQCRAAAVSGLVERIANEGLASVDTLVAVRDGKLPTYDPQGTLVGFAPVEAAQRRGAANDLLDRNPDTARIARSETKAATIIHFSPETVALLDRVIAERPGQQIVDAEIVAQIPASATACEPRHLDDIVEQYEHDGAVA
jgi:hypothetical protein